MFVRIDVRALAISPEPEIGKSQQIAGAFEMNAVFQPRDSVSIVAKPVLEVPFFTLSFRMAKAAWHRPSFVHDAGIGGEDKIGKTGYWV